MHRLQRAVRFLGKRLFGFNVQPEPDVQPKPSIKAQPTVRPQPGVPPQKKIRLGSGASMETLAAHLRANEDDKAQGELAELWDEIFRSPRKLNALFDLFDASGKSDLLLDRLLSPQSSALANLQVAYQVGRLAIRINRFDDFSRRVHAFLGGGGFARFRQFDFIQKMEGAKNEHRDLGRLLIRLKFSGIRNFHQPDHLVSNAKILVRRIGLNPKMVNHLFEHSRVEPKSRADWETSIRTAYAVHHLIVDGRLSEAAQNELVDESARDAFLRQIDPSRGALIMLCHAGFSTVRFSFLRRHVSNLTYMANTSATGTYRPDRISTNMDARGSLFAALKAVLEKRVVLLAPDGKQGARKSRISVLGKPTEIGEGAAFLAYESRCDTYWFSMSRRENRFVPSLIAGPSRQAAESFADFQERLNRFYEKMLNDFFSGDPGSLVLAPRWASHFGGRENEGAGSDADEMDDIA